MAKRGLPRRPCRAASTGATDIRASTAMTPVSSARTGLRSISRISGKSATSCDSLTSRQLDGPFVGSRHVAICLEDAGDAGARDQAMRELEIERRQRQRLVVDDLDRGAALPECDHRAERRIVGHADDQFARLRPHDHRKHRDAGRCARRASPRALGCRMSAGGFAHGVHVGEIEPDAADFGFVHDVRRLNFENDGIAVGEDAALPRRPPRRGRAPARRA